MPLRPIAAGDADELAAVLTRNRAFLDPWEPVRGDRYFTVLSVANDVGTPRLGLAIAKRSLPRAVDRNRIKRLIRESFRQCRSELPARDIVVLVKAEAGRAQNRELTDALARHWRRLGSP